MSDQAGTSWHGWVIGDGEDALYVGPFPRRKGIALWVIHGVHARPLAYFRTEADAMDALDMIDLINRVSVR